MSTATEIAALIREKRRREKRRETASFIVARLLFRITSSFLDGWFLMLAVGIAHAYWIPQLPTIGYWWAVVIVALLSGVFSREPPAKPKSKDAS